MATATSSRVPTPLPLPAMDWGVSAGAGGHRSLGWPLQDTARPPGGHPPHPALAGLSRGCHQLVPGAMGTLVSPIAAGTCSGPLCKQCLAKTPLGRDPRGMWQPALPSPACPRPSKVQNDTGSSRGGSGALAPAQVVGGSTALAGSSPGKNPPTPLEAPVHLRQPPCWHGTARRALPGDDKSRRD